MAVDGCNVVVDTHDVRFLSLCPGDSFLLGVCLLLLFLFAFVFLFFGSDYVIGAFDNNFSVFLIFFTPSGLECLPET